jgi:hypothetical protein
MATITRSIPAFFRVTFADRKPFYINLHAVTKITPLWGDEPNAVYGYLLHVGDDEIPVKTKSEVEDLSRLLLLNLKPK